MANRIQLRRDGAQQWANVNPILAQGELGIEIDTSRLKVTLKQVPLLPHSLVTLLLQQD